MPDWLGWPRLWYATPTFVLFIALQAPDWRFTGRVWVALVVWSLAGVAIDVRMTRYARQDGATFQQRDINRLLSGGVIFSFVLGIGALMFRPALNSVGHMSLAPPLNASLDRLAILLPGLDSFHHELLAKGQSDYAAYLGSFFVLIVAAWVAQLLLLYRAMVRLSQSEFAKALAAKKGFGVPPYGPRQRTWAWAGLMFCPALLTVALLFLDRIILADAAPAQPGTSIGQAFFMLGLAGWMANLFIYGFHGWRRFLSTLRPGGLL